jgi:transcriptional regulator with XRE-family HTH domain
MGAVGDALGRRMRKLRERQGLTQDALAKIVWSSRTAISDYEQGKRPPDAELMEKISGAIESDDDTLDEFYGLLGLGEVDSQTAAEAESSALAVSGWELRVVPALLQTPAYMLAAMRTAVRPDKLEHELTLRRQRQKRLTEFRSAWFVIDEACLRRVYGGREVMREQLLHLEEVAAMPNVGIQVMPYDETDHPGGDGPVYLYSFAGASMVSFTESKRAGRMTADRESVLADMHDLDQIKASARSVRSSIEMIRDIRETTHEQH